jgi:hypothetical protein
MTSRNDQFSKWKKIRNQGFFRFVLIHGVLGWGIGTAVLYSLIMWLMSDVDIGRLLPLALVFFPLGGLLWGAIVWWYIDRKYQQQALAGDS